MFTYNEFIYEKKLLKLLEHINLLCEEYDVGDEIIWDVDNDIELNKRDIEKYIKNLPNKWKPLISKIKKFIIKNKKNIRFNPNKFITTITSKINILKNIKLKRILIYIIMDIIVFNNIINVDEIKSMKNIKENKPVIEFIKRISPKKATPIDYKIQRNIIIKSNKLNDFLKKLAFKESTDNWKAIRYYTKNGEKLPAYVGKYQFGNLAFKDIKSTINVDDFHDDPTIWPENQQDDDMVKMLKKNKHYLRNFYHHIGKEIKGMEITESGILAAAHLVGNRSVKKFLHSDGKIDKTDANGIKCSDYMKNFNGYKLNI